MVPNVESVYGITTTKVVTTIGVESVPQRKNIFAKSNSSSWLFKKFWEFSNSEMITQKKSQATTSKFKNPCQKAVWRLPRHLLIGSWV